MTNKDNQTEAIGIIGGSGLYDLEGLKNPEEVSVETPFGKPSDSLIKGTFNDRVVYFLPRHGKGHRILPHELNHKANIWALKSVGVKWIVSATAVGSLKEEYKPRDIVIPDQFFDRTSKREHHTFFGNGIVAHIQFGDPVSSELRDILLESVIESTDTSVHNGGTYVNMDGPAFSTRAESETNRKLGFDVIGMTNLPEAKLAREAEIAFTTLAFITDYDCWKVEEENVSAESVISHLLFNAENAKKIISTLINKIPEQSNWEAHSSLDNALVTDRSLWPDETVESLKPILERFI